MNRYFDHNATSPLHPAARAAWLDAQDHHWHNPSSLYREAGAARHLLESCREAVADRLGCAAADILFLSGATEANNAVLAHAAAANLPHIALSAAEHPCVSDPAQHLFPGRLSLIPLSPHGLADLAALEEILATQRPALVALMAANNETGTLQPWREALDLCRRHRALFLCDAAQWIGKMPSHGLGACDFVTGSAHKFGGPKGIGFLKVPDSGRPFRWLRGGPQEARRRAGTENLPAIAALLAAWEAVESSATDLLPARLQARQAFEDRLRTLLPEATLLAAEAPRLWNTVLLALPPPLNVKWLARLSACGFAVSTGSACSQGAGASDVLLAMGLSGPILGQVLRLSAGWDTTPADWLALADALASVHAGMAQRPPSSPALSL